MDALNKICKCGRALYAVDAPGIEIDQSGFCKREKLFSPEFNVK